MSPLTGISEYPQNRATQQIFYGRTIHGGAEFCTQVKLIFKGVLFKHFKNTRISVLNKFADFKICIQYIRRTITLCDEGRLVICLQLYLMLTSKVLQYSTVCTV